MSLVLESTLFANCIVIVQISNGPFKHCFPQTAKTVLKMKMMVK